MHDQHGYLLRFLGGGFRSSGRRRAFGRLFYPTDPRGKRFFLDLNNQSDKAMTAGEDLGAAMVCAGLTLYQSEFGDLSYDVINKVEEETQDLMTPLYSLGGLTEEQLENGIAHVGTMCGFPAGTEVSSYTIDGITYLYVGFFVCPMEWELTVE